MIKIDFHSWVGGFEVIETDTSSAGLLSPKFKVLTDNKETGSEALGVHDSGQALTCVAVRP